VLLPSLTARMSKARRTTIRSTTRAEGGRADGHTIATAAGFRIQEANSESGRRWSRNCGWPRSWNRDWIRGGAGDFNSEDSPSLQMPSSTSSPATPSPSPQETPSPSPSPAGNLTKSDIELSLKTTQRQCFGSAGCNVTVEVRASVDQLVLDALPADGTWDVTYQISGDESGPIIGTFSLYGNGKYDVNEEFLSTPSENTPVRVKALDVERF
jgi:hypothetical protein